MTYTSIVDPGEPGQLITTGGVGGILAPDTAANPPPTLLPAVASTTGGTLAAATYFYVVTALSALGETLASNEVSVTTTGSTSSVALAWQSVVGAASYRVYRGTTTGGENTYYAAAGSGSTGGSFTDTGAAGTSGTPSKVSTFNPASGSLWSGRNRGGILTVPHNPDKATFVVNFGPIAATVATDLFVIESGPFMKFRLRRLVITNPGTQTTAATVALQLIRTTTAGTGGVVTPSPLDAGDFAFSGIVRVGNTTLGTAGVTLYTFAEVIPAAAVGAGALPSPVEFGGGTQLFKCPTGIPGITNGIAFRHPGAAGAAGLYGFAEFTEEPF